MENGKEWEKNVDRWEHCCIIKCLNKEFSIRSYAHNREMLQVLKQVGSISKPHKILAPFFLPITFKLSY